MINGNIYRKRKCEAKSACKFKRVDKSQLNKKFRTDGGPLECLV